MTHGKPEPLASGHAADDYIRKMKQDLAEAMVESKTRYVPTPTSPLRPRATSRIDIRASPNYNPVMKIDGLDWMGWLHKVRHEAGEKRIRDGLSVEQWLHQVRVRAAQSRKRRRSREYPTVVRDKPQSDR